MTHGGKREGAGPPRQMTNPARVTVTLEAEHLDALKERYGREWQQAARSLLEVEPETLDWLRQQAERDGLTVGRWLDKLAYRYRRGGNETKILKNKII